MFVARGDQGRAAVELIDDFEDGPLPRLRRCLRQQLPTDSQMERRALFIFDQRVGCFLHSVVDKPVGSRLVLDQFLTNGFPQSRMNLLLRDPEGD